MSQVNNSTMERIRVLTQAGLKYISYRRFSSARMAYSELLYLLYVNYLEPRSINIKVPISLSDLTRFKSLCRVLWKDDEILVNLVHEIETVFGVDVFDNDDGYVLISSAPWDASCENFFVISFCKSINLFDFDSEMKPSKDVREVIYLEEQLWVPQEPAYSFVLHIDGRQINLTQVCYKTRPGFEFCQSYAYWVEATFQSFLETFSMNNMLIGTGGNEIVMLGIQNYNYALAMQPSSRWLIAHRANAFRFLGNQYSPTSIVAISTMRLSNYIISLLLYDHALNNDFQGSNYYWALATMGALIANVRGFLPMYYDNVNDSIVRITLCAVARVLNVDVNTTPFEDLDRQFIELAIQMLTRSLFLVGDYFPWAQAYLGGCTVMLRMILSAHGYEPSSSILCDAAPAFMLDSLISDPQLLNGLSEPGQTFISPFLSTALISYWSYSYSYRQYEKTQDPKYIEICESGLLDAWKLAKMGSTRGFERNLIPGLTTIVVYGFLVLVYKELLDLSSNTSETYIVQLPLIPDVVVQENLSDNYGVGDMLLRSVDAEGLNTSWAELFDFIANIFWSLIVPNTRVFLPGAYPGEVVDSLVMPGSRALSDCPQSEAITSVIIGLQVVSFILLEFYVILDGKSGYQEIELRERVRRYLERIFKVTKYSIDFDKINIEKLKKDILNTFKGYFDSGKVGYLTLRPESMPTNEDYP